MSWNSLSPGKRRKAWTSVNSWISPRIADPEQLRSFSGNIATWNRPEMMEVHLAALRLGALFTPLNFRLREEELAYVLGDSAPSVLVTDTRCADTLGRVVEDYLSPERVFCTGGATGRGFPPYERLVEGQTPFRGRVNIQAADPCQLLYTSGTTARPKGVVLTHENVLWNAFNMIHARRDRPDDVALVVGPLFHAAALNSHFVPRLALGSTMVISEKFDPEEMMQTVRREGCGGKRSPLFRAIPLCSSCCWSTAPESTTTHPQ
ncbi:MAG: AMP-binding protein [Deltaproteobacteria bacterium]|nr:AMP-binding protein [Deltaproteobacteria bacterium]